MRWSTAITLLIIAVSISPATAQSPSSICDSYARNAVEFQRQNFEASCGLEGPEWNDNYNYHYDWCVNGQNYRTVDRWTAWRRERIAQCREASKTPQIQLPPPQSVWVNRIDPITNDVVARVNRGIDAIRSRSRQGRVQWQEFKPLDTRGIISAARSVTVERDQAAFEKTYQSAMNTARMDPKELHLPPQIHSVLALPRDGRVEPGTSLLITGANFGNKPGRVHLSYTVGRETPSTEARPEETVTETIALEPYNSSWTQSWFSNLVVAKATITYKDPFLAADRTGQLQLVLPDGSAATTSITVGSGAPEIESVQTASGHDWIKPGEEFVLHGRNFGDLQGKAKLDLAQSEAKRWQRLKGTNHYVYWPVAGPKQVGTIASVGVEIVRWNDRQVALKAGSYIPQSYFGGTTASLVLENTNGRSDYYNKIWFGPDTEVKVVSGYKWLDANARKAGKPTSNGGATVVTHIPSCGIFSSSGDKGGDVFFADAPWPSDVEVIGFDFQELDPEDPYGDLDFFLDQMSEIVDALTSGPFGIAEYIAGRVLSAIFSSGGGYHAYVHHEPGGYNWDKGPHVIGIGWETSCNLGGKPIVYVVSFTITGTKESLAKY